MVQKNDGQGDAVESLTEQGAGQASLGVGVRLGAEAFADLPAWTKRIEGKSSLVHPVQSRTKSTVRMLTSPDWKKTVRLWQRLGHVSLQYVPEARYDVPGRVAVLWDVSGSMSESMNLYLPWLYTLRSKWRRLGVFPFATRMADITEALYAPYPLLRAYLAEVEHVFAGGTNIGFALGEWVRNYGSRWLRSDTLIIIISDGWDVGVADDVSDALHTIRAHDTRIVWVNPWMGTPGFEPKTRTLVAALPFLERMVPGGTVASLLALANE